MHRDVHRLRTRVFGAEFLFHHTGKDAAHGAYFGDFFVEIHRAIGKDRDTRRKTVDIQTSLEQRTYDLCANSMPQSRPKGL